VPTAQHSNEARYTGQRVVKLLVCAELGPVLVTINAVDMADAYVVRYSA
jgi:hypothetical protein